MVEGLGPSEATPLVELLASVLRVAGPSDVLGCLIDIWVVDCLTGGDAVALWGVDKLLEVWASLAQSLDTVVLLAKGLGVHHLIVEQLELVAKCDFAKEKELRFEPLGVLEALAEHVSEVDTLAKHVAS